MRKLKLLLAGLLVGLMPLCGFAQQQTVDLPTTHQIVREALNSNATDAQDRFTAIETTQTVVCTIADLAQFKTGSVYNLPANRYFFCADINFGTDTINLNDANGIYTFYGRNFNLLTYTGVSNFISSDKTGISLNVIRLFMTSATGTFINLSNGNSLIVEIPVFINCLQCVTLDTMAFCTGDKVAMVGCGNGFTLDDVGTVSFQVLQWSVGTDSGGTALTLLGAASAKLLMNGIDSAPAATESYIDIQATYGGDMSIAIGVHTTGGGDFFKSGSRDQTDVDLILSDVKNVTSSKSTAAIHISPGDETATVVVLDTQVIVAGTFTEDVSERFTTNAAGRVTYTGKETEVFNFTVKFLATPASGTNKNYDFYLRLNGTTLIDVSFDTINVDSGTPGKAILIGEVELSTTDFLELIVIGRSPTPTNLTCEALAFVIF